MTDLVISPKTKQDIEAILKARPQSLLIVGSSGIGKQSIAELISEQLLEIESLDSYPYALSITPEEGKSIGIEAVRSLEHFYHSRCPLINHPTELLLF